jgi:hypothetical protein
MLPRDLEVAEEVSQRECGNPIDGFVHAADVAARLRSREQRLVGRRDPHRIRAGRQRLWTGLEVSQEVLHTSSLSDA